MSIARRAPDGERPWVADFKKAYHDGRFRDAADLFIGHAGRSEPAEIVLLAARAHLYTDPAKTIELLIGLKLPTSAARETSERDIVLAEAFSRTHAFDAADERLGSALALSGKIHDLELSAEVGYRYVRRYLQTDDVAKARTYLDLIRKGRTQLSRLRALNAEALILAHEERVEDQAQILLEMLRSMNPNSAEHIGLRAWATHALAGLARELYLPDAISEIERQMSGDEWPTDYAPNLFQTQKAVGWAKALQGDYFNGFRYLKLASETAHTLAWKVVAACDRSLLARSIGEPRWSRQELDEAERIARAVEWNTTLHEERIALLLMAELFCPLDPAKAAMYLARYRGLGEIKSSLYFRQDARINAFAQYSTGIVELALGSKRRGISLLRSARAVFERFGYDFRVARCLISEFHTTEDNNLLPLAAERLRNYGQSWLASELRSLGARPNDVKLPPMQRKVFDLICQGKTTAEMARSLGRSEYTITNHISMIFKAFDVNSRPALIAEAMRRGMIVHQPM